MANLFTIGIDSMVKAIRLAHGHEPFELRTFGGKIILEMFVPDVDMLLNGLFVDYGNGKKEEYHPGQNGDSGLYFSINSIDKTAFADFNRFYNGIDCKAPCLHPAPCERNKPIINGEKAAGCQDNHIAFITDLYVDVDTDHKTPKGQPPRQATAEEKELARQESLAIKEHIQKECDAVPRLYVCSGNGFHLHYALEPMENTKKNKETIYKVLTALGSLFDIDNCKIDTSVRNPSRVARIPGSWNTKCEPFLNVTIEESNEDSRPLSANDLQTIIESAPDAQTIKDTVNRGFVVANTPLRAERIDRVRRELAENGIDVYRETSNGMLYRFLLYHCVQKDIHASGTSNKGEAYFYITNTGYLGYHCSHHSCDSENKLTYTKAIQCVNPDYRPANASMDIVEDYLNKLESLPMLAEQFLSKQAESEGSTKKITQKAIKVLCKKDFVKHTTAEYIHDNVIVPMQNACSDDKFLKPALKKLQDVLLELAKEYHLTREIKAITQEYAKDVQLSSAGNVNLASLNQAGKYGAITTKYAVYDDENNQGVFSIRTVRNPITGGADHYLDFITTTPIIIDTIYENRETHMRTWSVSYKASRKAAQRTIMRPATFFTDTSKLKALADIGFPVDSNNSKKIAEYLNLYQQIKADAIETKDSVSGLGWHGDVLAPYSDDVPIDDPYNYQGLYDSLTTTTGTQEGALEIFRTARLNSPSFMFTSSAALASLLISKIKGMKNFVIVRNGDTGLGKSAELYALGNMFAYIPEESTESLIIEADSSKPATIEILDTINNFPLFRDENQTTTEDGRNSKPMNIYSFTQGHGRRKKNKAGLLAGAESWRNISFLNGEVEIEKEFRHGGEFNRVLIVPATETNPPFRIGKMNPAESARYVATKMTENAGWIARMFVKAFLSMKDKVLKFYEYVLSRIKKEYAGNIDDKMAQNFAVIFAADYVIKNSDICPAEKEKKMNMPLSIVAIYGHLKDDVSDGARAWGAFGEKLITSQNHIRWTKDTRCNGDVWGAYHDGRPFKSPYISLTKAGLSALLKSGEAPYFDLSKSILSHWIKFGYIMHDDNSERQASQRTIFEGHRQWVFNVVLEDDVRQALNDSLAQGSDLPDFRLSLGTPAESQDTPFDS